MNIFANFFLLHIIGDKDKHKEIIDLTMVSSLSSSHSSTYQFALSNHLLFSDEMKIDNIRYSSSPTQFLPTQASNNERSLTYEEFDHTINILNKKIESIYYLCQFLDDQVQEQTKLIKKLVTTDELSKIF